MAVTLAVLSPTVEDVQAAERAAEQAVELHQDGRLAEASEVLAQAYELYPDRDFLFMRGVIEREQEDCKTAVPLFEAFIAQHPSLVDVRAAQDEMELCRAAEPEPAPEPPPPDPVAAPPLPTPAPASIPAPDPVDLQAARGNAWRRDKPGGILLGAGLVLTTTGAVLLVAAQGTSNAADNAPTAGEYRAGRSDARTLGGSGWAVLGVGAAALVGSVIRYSIVARRNKARRD